MHLDGLSRYCEIAPEAELVLPRNRPSVTWPSLGHIQIQNLEMRYRTGLDTVLKGITLNIEPGEKVGVAGRTGPRGQTQSESLTELSA
jgi:ATP-binding cassette subfamily C (CFTR/MRP) protein 1